MAQTARMTQIETMLADDPNDAMLRYMLGMEYVSATDDAGAVRVFQELLAIQPYVPAFHMAGQALNRLGRVSEACSMLKNGIAAARQQGDSHALGEMETLLGAIE
jgi:uncharacterized protein HemY